LILAGLASLANASPVEQMTHAHTTHASSHAVAAKFHVGQRFTGSQFLVTMPECRQVSQYIVNRRDAERRPPFVRFIGAFPVKEIQKWNNTTGNFWISKCEEIVRHETTA
jgi:hypothetical protein